MSAHKMHFFKRLKTNGFVVLENMMCVCVCVSLKCDQDFYWELRTKQTNVHEQIVKHCDTCLPRTSTAADYRKITTLH